MELQKPGAHRIRTKKGAGENKLKYSRFRVGRGVNSGSPVRGKIKWHPSPGSGVLLTEVKACSVVPITPATMGY